MPPVSGPLFPGVRSDLVKYSPILRLDYISHYRPLLPCEIVSYWQVDGGIEV